MSARAPAWPWPVKGRIYWPDSGPRPSDLDSLQMGEAPRGGRPEKPPYTDIGIASERASSSGGVDVAKGKRGRPQGVSGGQRGGGTLPGRRGKKRARGGSPQQAAELPTAAPSAAQIPAGSSLFGGAVAAPPHAVGRPRQREIRRGGPRAAEERFPRRRLAPLDFSYMRRDLVWVGATSVASVGLVLVLWIVLRV